MENIITFSNYVDKFGITAGVVNNKLVLLYQLPFKSVMSLKINPKDYRKMLFNLYTRKAVPQFIVKQLFSWFNRKMLRFNARMENSGVFVFPGYYNDNPRLIYLNHANGEFYVMEKGLPVLLEREN